MGGVSFGLIDLWSILNLSCPELVYLALGDSSGYWKLARDAWNCQREGESNSCRWSVCLPMRTLLSEMWSTRQNAVLIRTTQNIVESIVESKSTKLKTWINVLSIKILSPNWHDFVGVCVKKARGCPTGIRINNGADFAAGYYPTFRGKLCLRKTPRLEGSFMRNKFTIMTFSTCQELIWAQYETLSRSFWTSWRDTWDY